MVAELDPCLSLLTKLLGEAGNAMGWEANEACCRALSWALTARRCLLFPEGRPKQVGVETRRRPEAPTVPRADPAPTAATAEEVKTRVAKKAARNKKQNKARSERRQRKREAKNSWGGEQGSRDIAPPPHMAWTSGTPHGVDLCPTSPGPSCPTILLALDGFLLVYHFDYLNRCRFA